MYRDFPLSNAVHTRILDKPLDKTVAACRGAVLRWTDFGQRRNLMARVVKDARLETRAARGKLAPSGKPYYRAMHEGLHLGYRKGKDARKWVVRNEGDYKVETIGQADDFDDPNGTDILNFRQAQDRAREKYNKSQEAAKAAADPAPEAPFTVRDAIGVLKDPRDPESKSTGYLAFLEHNRRTARDAQCRAEALILPKLGDEVCEKLTTEMLQNWLRETAASPPRLRTRKKEDQKYRTIDPDDDEAQRRRKSAANRTWTIFRAALNQAWRAGRIKADERIWKRVKAFEDVDAARPRWLNNDESRRFIKACQGQFKTLVRAGLHTGAAYGNLAAANVEDFRVVRVRKSGRTEVEQGTLHIVRYKGKGGKVRHVDVQLTNEAIAFLRSITTGRSPSEPLLPQADGTRWQKSQQARPMKEASKNARINPPVGFHTLRHAWASQAVMAGMPLLVVAKNLGHADTRMVEKHYGHLAPSYIAEQVQQFAPRFGSLPEDDAVQTMR